ncbi:fructose-bisphosphatase class III [Staphylococcus aureus]
MLELPKGTEHFVSDLHGEYEAFQHVLRTVLGMCERKSMIFSKTSYQTKELNDLTALVYYPEDKLQLIKCDFKITDN